MPSVTRTESAPIEAFTPAERDYNRRELDMFFSTLPAVADWFPAQDFGRRTGSGEAEESPEGFGSVINSFNVRVLQAAQRVAAGVAQLRGPNCRSKPTSAAISSCVARANPLAAAACSGRKPFSSE